MSIDRARGPVTRVPTTPSADASQVRDVPSPLTRMPRKLWLPLLLLVIASIPWRRGVYFSGGLDTVVVAKAGLTVLAVVLSLPAARVVRRPIPATPFIMLGLYLAVSVLGAWQFGDLLPTVAVAARVALAAVVLYCLLAAFDPRDVLVGLSRAMLVVGGFAAITGLPTLTSGRLSGGVPPIAPNEIAVLCGVPFVVLLWRVVYVGRNRFDALVLVVLAATVYLTASRTGIALLVAGSVLLLMRAKHIRGTVVVGLVASLPLMAYVAVFTDVLSGFLDRGGTGNTATLNSRTIAWSAAADLADEPLQHLMGAGLSRKIIEVTGQYWSTQTLDSTWVSTLVQAGYLGLVLLTALIVYGAVCASRTAAPFSVLLWVLLVFSVGRSILESGMLDASSGFLAFFVVVTAAGALQLRRADSVVTPRASGPFEDRAQW